MSPHLVCNIVRDVEGIPEQTEAAENQRGREWAEGGGGVNGGGGLTVGSGAIHNYGTADRTAV